MKKDVRKVFFQNDFAELPGVYDGGCLFMDLVDIVAEAFGKYFKRSEIVKVYKICNDSGFLGSSLDSDSLGAFVWNHEGVLNTATNILGEFVTWRYCARIYTEAEKSKGRTCFVNDRDYGSNDSFLIMQLRTTAVNGHFKRFRYDPWKMGSQEIMLKSVRYYKRN